MKAFKDFFNDFKDFLAILRFLFPSNLKGKVKIPKVIASFFWAISAKTGAAPEPAPPPNDEIIIEMS